MTDDGFFNVMKVCEFRSVYRSGGFKEVVLLGDETRFWIYGTTTKNERILLVATRRVQRRYFGKAEQAFRVMQEMGVMECKVALQRWRPDEEPMYMRRRDVAYRMKKVHELGKKQMEEEKRNAPPRKSMAELYEEGDRLAAMHARTPSGPRLFVDDEGRVDVARTDAWLQAELRAKERAEWEQGLGDN